MSCGRAVNITQKDLSVTNASLATLVTQVEDDMMTANPVLVHTQRRLDGKDIKPVYIIIYNTIKICK